ELCAGTRGAGGRASALARGTAATAGVAAAAAAAVDSVAAAVRDRAAHAIEAQLDLGRRSTRLDGFTAAAGLTAAAAGLGQRAGGAAVFEQPPAAVGRRTAVLGGVVSAGEGHAA